mgnify:CR=1 FL=1
MPKKHKQRFEHTCETTQGGYVNFDKILKNKERNGWELVTAINVAIENQQGYSEYYFTFFFKRPV